MENGLVLLEHIYHHLPGGLSLRQLIDWMLYVHQELDDETWKNSFQPVVRELGIEQLAIVATRTAQIYLGLQETNCTWCRDADEETCALLIEHLLENGNFGGKMDKESLNEVEIMNALRRAPFQRLQKAGMHNWKAAQKYPILRPFAWFYQIFHYLRKGIARKNWLSKVASDMKKSREQAELFARLGLEIGYSVTDICRRTAITPSSKVTKR